MAKGRRWWWARPQRPELPPDPFGPPATHEASDRLPEVAPAPVLPPTVYL